MNLTSKSTPKIEMVLHPRDVLTLNETNHRMAIECKEGLIWVTCTGDSRDHMLQAGRRYIPQTKGNVVIEAIDEACVDIEEPA
jgi:hypothetical protein